jgi:hypothetical protein
MPNQVQIGIKNIDYELIEATFEKFQTLSSSLENN